jgi:hypothetical protein
VPVAGTLSDYMAYVQARHASGLFLWREKARNGNNENGNGQLKWPIHLFISKAISINGHSHLVPFHFIYSKNNGPAIHTRCQ